jgi:uncharacterized protein YcfL
VIRRAGLLAVAALLCVACMSSDDDDATSEKHIVFDKGSAVWIADGDGDHQP